MSVAIDISYPGIAVISLVFAGIGLYIKTYVTKKAENLATREDVAAITQTTKSIEAKISDEFWNKQKRWELKREVLFEAAKRLAEVDDALSYLTSVYQYAHQHPTMNLSDNQSKVRERWIKATASIDETKLLVEIVCGSETISAFENFVPLAQRIAVEVIGKDPEAFAKSKESFFENLIVAKAAIRKELGFDETRRT
ncbi:MAG: hypothetical protein WCA89_02855 [Terracidiphilus sp.]|jgi:hypothetical protein